jgi:hypothetical protein
MEKVEPRSSLPWQLSSTGLLSLRWVYHQLRATWKDSSCRSTDAVISGELEVRLRIALRLGEARNSPNWLRRYFVSGGLPSLGKRR